MSVGFIRSIASWIVDTIIGDNIFSTLLRTSKYSSVRDFNEYAAQKIAYDKLFYEEVLHH